MIRTVEADGIRCPIDPDFRIMCDLSEGDKSVPGRFFFAGLPEGVSAKSAIDAMMAFFRRGLLGRDADEDDEDEDGGSSAVPIFKFGEDEGYFYAAFLSEYGIDLYTAKLHWYAFCMLFRGLSDECRLKQMIAVRAVKMSDVPKYDRKRIAKLKKVYALEAEKEKRYASVEERDAAVLAEQARYAERLAKKMEKKRAEGQGTGNRE